MRAPKPLFAVSWADVIIVGGGASGALLACHLLRDPACKLRVTLIEKGSEVGRGIAYFTDSPGHLLNVRACNMSAFPDQPDHFWRWLNAYEPGSAGGWRHCGDPFCFVPRRFYGDYIASLIAPLSSDGSCPGRLRIVRGECVSIRPFANAVTVTLADGSSHRGRIAVLATGHESSASTERYYVDPWTNPTDAGVTPDARVLILGTGLTMIDYVLSLLLAGHKGPIKAISRRGLVPRGHRDVQPLAISRTDVPFGEGPSYMLRWLRGLIQTQTANGNDWRGAVDGLRPFTQDLWQHLSVSSRRSFLEHARAWWEVHRHRMAPEIEARITETIRSGRLTVLAAKLCAIEPGAAAVTVHYRRRGASTVETWEAEKIVDCRGFGATPFEVVNPVLRSLLDRGLARLDPLRIGIDIAPECAIIDHSGTPSQRLFAVGPLTRAAFWETTAVPDIRNQCMALAERIARTVRAQDGLALATTEAREA
jgi:uncharacterized NAD(P)/FAD-binding protein YdhS